MLEEKFEFDSPYNVNIHDLDPDCYAKFRFYDS